MKINYPIPKNAATTRSMQGNKSKDTKPEIMLRSLLWSANLRGFRKDYKKLAGRPDVVYVRFKTAIFIHGCFWHRCPKCALPMPKNNVEFWENKIS